MWLTQGKLPQQDNWLKSQTSEYLQLDQYNAQGMFGDPVGVDKDNTVFCLVWTYRIKTLDQHKKARCVCDGFLRSWSVKVLDETYSNCIDQTSSWLFYAVTSGENLLVFCAVLSNAFAEAPPPKQCFYIQPNTAFDNWWLNQKHQPPIPPGHVIPALSAMKGHPKAPWLREKHVDAILHELRLTPTVHELCIYSGAIAGN